MKYEVAATAEVAVVVVMMMVVVVVTLVALTFDFDDNDDDGFFHNGNILDIITRIMMTVWPSTITTQAIRARSANVIEFVKFVK